MCYSRAVFGCARIGQGGSDTSTSLVSAIPCQPVKPCQALCTDVSGSLIGIIVRKYIFWHLTFLDFNDWAVLVWWTHGDRCMGGGSKDRV